MTKRHLEHVDRAASMLRKTDDFQISMMLDRAMLAAIRRGHKATTVGFIAHMSEHAVYRRIARARDIERSLL